MPLYAWTNPEVGYWGIKAGIEIISSSVSTHVLSGYACCCCALYNLEIPIYHCVHMCLCVSRGQRSLSEGPGNAHGAHNQIPAKQSCICTFYKMKASGHPDR